MSFTTTDYCDISTRPKALGLNVPDGLSFLPLSEITFKIISTLAPCPVFGGNYRRSNAESLLVLTKLVSHVAIIRKIQMLIRLADRCELECIVIIISLDLGVA